MKIDLVRQLLDWDEPKGAGIVREVFYTRGSLMYSGLLPNGTIEVSDAPHVYVVIKHGVNHSTEVTPAVLYRSGNLALMGFLHVADNWTAWIADEKFTQGLTTLVLSHVYDGEPPNSPVQPSKTIDVIALREAAERGEPMRAEDTLALLDMNERNFRVAVELSELHRSYTPRYADPAQALQAGLRQTAQRQAEALHDELYREETVLTTAALIGRKVRIQTTADLSDWYWKYRADVEECRDLKLQGKIEQANDERGSWWAFVTFAGRNGYWLPLTALTFSEPHR